MKVKLSYDIDWYQYSCESDSEEDVLLGFLARIYSKDKSNKGSSIITILALKY